MTTILNPIPTPILTNEQKFLKDLEGILPADDFNARIFPSEEEGKIRKARVNTNLTLDLINIKKLIALAAKWNLPLFVARSGAGLKILFGKE